MDETEGESQVANKKLFIIEVSEVKLGLRKGDKNFNNLVKLVK